MSNLPLRPRQIQMISLRLEAEILDSGEIEESFVQSGAKNMLHAGLHYIVLTAYGQDRVGIKFAI